MARTRVPTQTDLFLPTLKAIHDLGGSASKFELQQRIVEICNLSEGQMDVVFPENSRHKGRPKVFYNLEWARSNLKAIDALASGGRGISSITAKGIEFLKFDDSVAENRLKAEVRAWRRRNATSSKTRSDTPIDDRDMTDEGQTLEEWRVQLIDVLKRMDPVAFERLSIRLLKEAGFEGTQSLGGTGDGGIDGVGVYKISLVSFPIYLQCKRYAGSVGANVVRDFRGAMAGRGEKGLIITTGTFTPAARAEATRDGAPPVDLVDGDEFCDLIVKHGLGVKVTERRVMDVAVDEDFFAAL